MATPARSAQSFPALPASEGTTWDSRTASEERANRDPHAGDVRPRKDGTTWEPAVTSGVQRDTRAGDVRLASEGTTWDGRTSAEARGDRDPHAGDVRPKKEGTTWEPAATNGVLKDAKAGDVRPAAEGTTWGRSQQGLGSPDPAVGDVRPAAEGTTWDAAKTSTAQRDPFAASASGKPHNAFSVSAGTDWDSKTLRDTRRANDRAKTGNVGLPAGGALVPASNTEVRGKDAERIRDTKDGEQWDVTTAMKAVYPGGTPILLPDPSQVFDKPRPRYGYPGAAKGAIYALDPNDNSRGDALYFSRFPETLNETIEAALASDTTPGRAYPAIQQMGAKGVKLSTELWFCDAFLWSGARGAAGGEIMLVNGGKTKADRVVRAQATLAEQARQFFEFYVAGHDGTGVALPPADIYLHWGDRELPIPIVIERVEMHQEHFSTAGMRPGFPGGAPQTVTVKIDMLVNVPLRVVDPFRPRQPVRGKKPPVKRGCPTPGSLTDGSWILKGKSAGDLAMPAAPSEESRRRMRIIAEGDALSR